MTTIYIAGIYERQGTAYTSYYEGGGLRRSGYSSNNGVFYMLSDHLKSTSALVARNGVLNVKYFYYPYGARRGVPFNTITARHFTGQYHETSLPGGEGLSYYGARWYDPKLGRFLSADTIVPNASNPQDLNRFAYVRNNPLRYVDPSGHILCDGATSCAQGGSAQPGSGAAKKPPAPPPPPSPNPNTYQKTYGNDVKPSRLPSITQEPQYQTVRVAMANMVWFEEGSDGGSDQSMTAAAYVVRNRAEGNLDRILSLLVPNGEFQGYQGAFRPDAVSGAMWMKILGIVDSVLIGTVQDPTGGAEYFGNVFDETEALDYQVALAHWVSTQNPAYSGLDFNDESDRQLLLYYAGYGEIARLDHKVFVFNAMEPIKLTPGGRVIYPPLQLTPSVNWTFASK